LLSKGVADEVGEMLGRVTFAELVARAKEEESVEYQI